VGASSHPAVGITSEFYEETSRTAFGAASIRFFSGVFISSVFKELAFNMDCEEGIWT
jgi:hypothetical protein